MSVVAAGIGAAVSIGGGIFASSSARREARRKARQARKLEAKLNQLEANRQEIINPYEDSTSLSNMMSNPFATLSVSTAATEIQMEQTDIALANTLDTIRQTGGGAGGATALAQAALQSKKDIAANLESQEKANDDKRVQGEKQLQNQLVGEEQRMQGLDAAGKSFVYGETEKREQQQLDRVSNQIAALRGQESQARADATGAITGAIGSVAGIAGGLGGKI
tara:strand:+ start:570 stop:1235 length:666 start_codon:yes stop_codon:yes gene_type:complete